MVVNSNEMEFFNDKHQGNYSSPLYNGIGRFTWRVTAGVLYFTLISDGCDRDPVLTNRAGPAHSWPGSPAAEGAPGFLTDTCGRKDQAVRPAIATTRAAIMMTQPTHDLGSITPKIAGLTVAAFTGTGGPSAGQTVSQPSHVRTAASDPAAPSRRDCG